MADGTLRVRVVSPDQLLFDGRARQVSVPGEAGVFEIHPFHRPIVSRLLPGMLLIDGQSVPILRGVVKVEFDSVTAIIEPDVSSE